MVLVSRIKRLNKNILCLLVPVMSLRFFYRDRMGISKQELVAMLEEDELKDAILGKDARFFLFCYFPPKLIAYEQ